MEWGARLSAAACTSPLLAGACAWAKPLYCLAREELGRAGLWAQLPATGIH